MVVVVSGPLAQESSVRARIENAKEKMIERGVFIDFGQWKFTILSRRWLSCQPLYRMKTVLGHGVSRDRRLPKDKRGVDLISDALPFGRLWYDDPNAVGNAVGYATFFSRSHDAVIRVYDEAGNVIETHEHTGDFREW